MPKPRTTKKVTIPTAGERFRAEVVDSYELTPDSLVILEAVVRTIDTVSELDAAMADEPLVVRGSAGQLREHPLLSEARQQRLALSRLIRQLGLPDPEELAEVREAVKSRRARAAAGARWSA